VMRTTMFRCRTCDYWFQAIDQNGAAIINDRGQTQGECHRRPPSVHYVNAPQGLQIRTQFPLTHGDMHCGEYSPIEGVQV